MNDPAFPRPDDDTDYHPGLTKREYFAAAALTGLCASSVNHKNYANTPLLREMSNNISQVAFAIADAMMDFADPPYENTEK